MPGGNRVPCRDLAANPRFDAEDPTRCSRSIERTASNGAFTPEQDNDKTTIRLPDRCERHHRNAQVQHLSCRCLVVVLLWCENTIKHKNEPFSNEPFRAHLKKVHFSVHLKYNHHISKCTYFAH